MKLIYTAKAAVATALLIAGFHKFSSFISPHAHLQMVSPTSTLAGPGAPCYIVDPNHRHDYQLSRSPQVGNKVGTSEADPLA